MLIATEQIENFERRYRANFINSLGGFKSVVLLGSRSLQGNENLSVISSLFHIGADPALCGIIIRPNEPTENTLGNILNTGVYTLNHIHPAMLEQAHQCSARYEAGYSEFEATGLQPEYIEEIEAPFVAESRIKFACSLIQKTDIEWNGTFLLIGKIMRVVVPDELVSEDGYIDIENAETLTCSGLDSYHRTNRIARFSYAKTDRPLRKI
jgi:flavin reductase (DIM6/NTAB) family NADH-FMN oxidoreductase RutF